MNIIQRKDKINILICMGTRPEGIKLAPVVELLKNRSETFKFKICSTGQHKEMLDQVFRFFNIKPDYDLSLMTENQSLGYLSSRILTDMNKVLTDANPDVILIQGDTTTAFLTALSGFYKRIRVGHVEAGLRTYDKYNPFPEEINRRMVSVIADYHFAPTKGNRKNLLSEGISADKIFVTGNTVIDALLMTVENGFGHEVIAGDYEKLILVTAHRRENFGEPLKNIFQAIRHMAEKYPRVRFVYPVHLNNNVQKPAVQILNNVPNVKLLPPLDYFTFVNILARTDLVLTDSGGIQEEAPALGIPVLVLRNETERPEAVEVGTVKIVGTVRDKIIQETLLLLKNNEAYQKMAQAINPYGDGKASQRILNCITNNILK